MPEIEDPPLRRHQQEALTALDEATDEGLTRSWIVLPPGAGKTRVGIEHARRLLDDDHVGTVVAFGPNTAIQTQWAEAWNTTASDPTASDPAATDRSVTARFTALTYQSLAVFDGDRESSSDLLTALAPGGMDLVTRLAEVGPLLLIFDECHHLLEVWGQLLSELLDRLPNARVLGLTATPPQRMTQPQAELVATLFSQIRYAASIPAVVREGDLAPFADLVWLTTPTVQESDWLSGHATRFTELITGILDPERGTVPFLTWVDRRFLGVRDDMVDWESLTSAEPELCAAALRLHHAGLLRLPVGARPTEAHHRDPGVDDWALLIGDWMRGHLDESDDESDHDLAEAVRRALPAVGYRWTRKGIRRGRSPVDRVLSHSAAKPQAAIEIVAAEAAMLGQRQRTLILCDFESATATLSTDLTGVLSDRSGSAMLVADTLIADERTASLSPLLVSGKTVAGHPDVLRALIDHLGEVAPDRAAGLSVDDPDAALARIEGRWTSRDWVPAVTRFFAAGRSRVLIGTRALLGEGWDAPQITGVIDLTSATTPTAVTQTRGRALRRDPGWGEKVALNWTVVCVSKDHVRGDQDWQRLVRKHDGFFGTDADGEVVDGIAHIDPEFSVFGPPAAERIDPINVRMLARSEDRTDIARRWRVGTEYRDEAVRSLRITKSNRAEVEPEQGIAVTPRHPRGDPGRVLPFSLRWGALLAWTAAGLVLAVLGAVIGGPVGVAFGVLAVAVWLSWGVVLLWAGGRRLGTYARRPRVGEMAGAVAEALAEAGLTTAGAEAVHARVDARGVLRCHLDAESASADVFARALDEAVSTIADPRYVLPRWSLPGRGEQTGWFAVHLLRSGWGQAQMTSPVWHAVPSVLGAKKRTAQIYARAFDRWIGGGEVVATRSPEGAGVLAAERGRNPMAMDAVLRTSWR